MIYDSILARSFSKHEQRKLGCGAFLTSLIIVFTVITVFKPYLGPLRVLNLRVSLGAGLEMLRTEEILSEPQQKEITRDKKFKPICSTSEPRSDVCQMSGDIRIHGNSSTVFVAVTASGTAIFPESSSWKLRPYARKGDRAAMEGVREFTVKMVRSSSQYIPNCTHNHSVPAIVFSTGGYAGNHFHDFNDVVIPLYLTSREFHGEVKFLISDKEVYWVEKFKEVLKHLSKYEVTDIDGETGVHCFPRMVVGLKHHGEFKIDPSRSPYSMKQFREFLKGAYSLKRETAIKTRDGEFRRPRLLIISRRRSRSFTNEVEIVQMARSLGFEVIVVEAFMNLATFSQLVNSCDVMMGVHGAGLTNIVFLPENAVFIQIVPLGGLEWLARTDFGEPAKAMNLRYIEYKIGENESSLWQEYPPQHQVFRDPYSIQKEGWPTFSAVYLERQNVKLDVGRFRATLLEALNLLQM
ncbi:alpha-1,3-arabinosyltransferase XAT3 [Diospyros lotus]|uniref:alpha-1,3-arabinosyltransferase XAT3 n=1 Tax=Diospyros lotus TaxID=55363 RepID=UPI00224D29BC|nr:alpha-1,3-arabinosyltransferase XAT3 [Diospyros lotus]